MVLFAVLFLSPGLPTLGDDPEEHPKPVIEDREKTAVGDMDEWLQDVMFIKESSVPFEEIVTKEVDRYLGVDVVAGTCTSGLEWWKENETFFPNLSVLAKKYLAIPASSVSSERVFSLTGNIVNKKRARLSERTIGMITFMNKNMVYYW